MSLSVHMHISQHAEILSVSLSEVRVRDHFLQSLVASWRDEHLNKMGNQATFMCLAPDFELQDLKHYFCKKTPVGLESLDFLVIRQLRDILLLSPRPPISRDLGC